MKNRNARKMRQNQRDFYQQTQENQNAPLQDLNRPMKKRQQNGPTPRWHYQAPTYGIPIALWLLLVIGVQYLGMTFHNMVHKNDPANIFISLGASPIYVLSLLFVVPILMLYFYKKFKANWENTNAMYLDDDQITTFKNDAYIRTADNLSQELDPVPDVGLGFDAHASTLMGHQMMSNKGIKKIDMPQYDSTVDGYVKRDEDGNVVTKRVPLFNPALADKLFSMSGVPQEFRTLYDATDYDFNRRLSRKEGGGKDENGNPKRAGAYGRKPYDKLADYINNEFFPIDTDTERPAGIYWVDTRPVNTILIAITRAGKGQTYIEPAFDVWTREKDKWNIFTTDPKGELLAKFYYPATIRGFEIVQFNLMHPHLTNVYNPLANAVQAFRQNNPVKGTALIDSIVDTLFPDNGEIWNSAAGNMFRRAVYLLFDYYIEQENYIRYLGHKNGTPQDLIDENIDKNYQKMTLFNVYSLIGELAAKVSKDVKFINVDPDIPQESEKDLLTLIFDAMAMLPENTLRSKAITANNAIKQIAGAQQTIAGIYATLLTGLSVYADDTAIALMSGSLNESFDVAGLGFPRRIGIQFDDAYVKKFRLAKELCEWSIYRDKEFTDRYEGKAFEHSEKVAPSNWVWGYFAGKFDQEETYIKLTVKANGGTIAKEFFFKFTKGYKKYDGISYVIDPITHQKVVSGGTLIELDAKTKEPKVSEFLSKQIDVVNDSYHDVKKPILTSNQIFYSEKPKFVFAITPPHLQVYQKHILIIIKQILDEQYSNSYVVKSNRKPIVGTRLMLEEFGNIRSGDKGIPNIDTATSIALGQNVQITFVLQSFQQLRAIYKEDVEKIIRANASNTIFLKSNDEELVNELVRLSGVKHEMQTNNKSISRKKGDVVNIPDPTINYSSEQKETTALTSNDLLFLAGPQPGNSITFSSGEMPIVGKLSTITPMAAGLHKHLPEPVGGQYSDSTMPSTNTNDAVNFLDNMIDGEALVHARVDQATIWHDTIKPKLEKIAKDNDIVLNERDGSIADLVMNAVYETYEKQSGQKRTDMNETVVYWQVAEKLLKEAKIVSNKQLSSKERLAAVGNIREALIQCAKDDELDDLTKIYRDTSPSSKVNMGFDDAKISEFIMKFHHAYPKPKDDEYEKQDVYAKAKENQDYHEYQGNQELLFDPLNNRHTQAFEQIVGDVIDGTINPPKGMEISPLKQSDENSKPDDKAYEIKVNNVHILNYTTSDDGNNYQVDWPVNQNEQITKAIIQAPAVLQSIQGLINDMD